MRKFNWAMREYGPSCTYDTSHFESRHVVFKLGGDHTNGRGLATETKQMLCYSRLHRIVAENERINRQGLQFQVRTRSTPVRALTSFLLNSQLSHSPLPYTYSAAPRQRLCSSHRRAPQHMCSFAQQIPRIQARAGGVLLG